MSKETSSLSARPKSGRDSRRNISENAWLRKCSPILSPANGSVRCRMHGSFCGMIPVVLQVTLAEKSIGLLQARIESYALIRIFLGSEPKSRDDSTVSLDYCDLINEEKLLPEALASVLARAATTENCRWSTTAHPFEARGSRRAMRDNVDVRYIEHQAHRNRDVTASRNLANATRER
jgi:hypothetical protein